MQWDSRLNGGFSDAKKTFFPVISDQEYGYDAVNVANQLDDEQSYLNATKFLLKVRKAHPELQRGDLILWETANRAVFAYWRKLGDQQTLCVYNLSPEVQSIYLHFPELSGKIVDLLHEGRWWSLNKFQLPPVLKMRPYASHWLSIQSN